MNLTKFQISAVKNAAKELTPLDKKLELILKKRADYLAKSEQEEIDIQEQKAAVHQVILNITGGLPLEEVLNPESAMLYTPVLDNIDDAEVAEVAQVFPEPELK